MKKNMMPTIPMRGLVIFPGMILHFDVGRDYSVNAVRAAAEGDRRIFLVIQKDITANDPEKDGVRRVGVVAEVRQTLSTPDGNTRVLVEGLYRAAASDFHREEKYFAASPVLLKDRKNTFVSQEEHDAYLRTLKDSYSEYCSFLPKMPKELFQSAMSRQNLTELIDLVIFNTYFKPEDRQALLETVSEKKRVELLLKMLESEIEILILENEISDDISDSIDKNQREYYLREQLRAIAHQLGDEEPMEESVNYREKIIKIGFPKEVEEKLLKDTDKLMKMSPNSQDSAVIRNYLDTVLDLPWNKRSDGGINMEKAEKQLDKDHYGLKKVKERILETIAVRALNPNVKGQILCLVGPPGVGKTSVGKSIAKAVNRSYARISLGGVGDEAEIRGHRKTYIGAMPGRIVKAITQAKTMNPVIVLDEIDKLRSDYKGDPASALLEVLDPEQNVSFADHYLEIPLDLSDVMFITTANSLDTIPAPLLDRMEVIELPSYTREEKFHIAKKHLIPKQLKKHGERSAQLKIANDGIYSLIDYYTREAGVRRLEQQIAALCRKTAKKLLEGEAKVTVSAKNIGDFLGVKKYLPETLPLQDEVGTVTGLAWTSAGGVTMPLEVLVMNGTGKLELTGSLGEVM
ncbi:MAG: endopeptidase La, partial [[Eubacterium] siraeum]|nr:endopeptidase La [[Eubacterium] siraeum]